RIEARNLNTPVQRPASVARPRRALFALSALRRTPVEIPQVLQVLAYPGLQPSVGRLVEMLVQPVGEVALPGGISCGLVLRVAVVAPVAQVLHELRGGVAQVLGNGAGAVPLDELTRGAVRRVDGVALG